MALLLIQTTDTCDYVHADDPEAHAPKGAEGWIPKTHTGANGKATTITIRPLNGFQQLECHTAASTEDGVDQAEMVTEVLSRGLIAIDGSESKVAEFVGSPSSDYLMSIFTLVMEAGANPTRGRDSDT